MIDHRPDERAKQHFNWKAALYAGLVVGFVFLFLSRGVPWGSMGFGQAAMGRTLPINNPPEYIAVNSIAHMVLAVLYAFLVGIMVFRFELAKAILVGAIAGLVLYGLNCVAFHFIGGLPANHEVPVLVTHIFFAMITAAAYKAFSVPTVRERERTTA